jgi:hypothetical protein
VLECDCGGGASDLTEEGVEVCVTVIGEEVAFNL